MSPALPPEVHPAVLVGLGGVAGAVARHRVAARVETDRADTALVNVLGSALLGAVATAPVGADLVLLVGTGFCGAFTTFSSFAVETVRLAEAGRVRRAGGYAGVTLFAALLGVGLGAAVATVLARLGGG